MAPDDFDEVQAPICVACYAAYQLGRGRYPWTEPFHRKLGRDGVAARCCACRQPTYDEITVSVSFEDSMKWRELIDAAYAKATPGATGLPDLALADGDRGTTEDGS